VIGYAQRTNEKAKTMARPTKFTPQVQARILDAIALGLTYEQAATSAGVHEESFRKFRLRNAEFVGALKKAEIDGMTARLERIQMAAVRDGAWQADAWWLERRYPDQWGKRERVDVNHTGSVDVRLAVRQMQAALDEVLPDDPKVRRLFAQKVMALDNGESMAS
jgi:transposase